MLGPFTLAFLNRFELTQFLRGIFHRHTRRLVRIVIALSTCLVAFSSSANEDEKYQSLVSQLKKCQEVTDLPEKVNCFDSLTNKVLKKAPKKVIPVQVEKTTSIEKSIAHKSKQAIENDFAKSQAGSEYLKRNQKENVNIPLKFTLKKARKDKQGFWRFYFENGQIWKQVERRRIPQISEFPIQCSLSSGMFGSYRLKLEGSDKTVKVKRLK